MIYLTALGFTLICTEEMWAVTVAVTLGAGLSLLLLKLRLVVLGQPWAGF